MTGGGRRWESSNSRRNPSKQKLRLSAEEVLESKFGFDLFTEGEKRLGWLLTLASSSWEEQGTCNIHSCVDLFFVCQDGSKFKAKYVFQPYFYVATKEKMQLEVDAYLRRRYEGQISNIEIMEKEDLDLKNHLSGLCGSYLKVSFDTVQQLTHVRNDLLHVVERNQARLGAAEAYESIYGGKGKERPQDYVDCITDLREYDVPYHVRFAIDNDVRCGQWYDVSVSSRGLIVEKRTDLLQRAEVHVCAFDIETTKLPLKFPDAEYDQIMMVSYMIDAKGYLIINREFVGADIEDLEYTPKPEFEGCFNVKNVENEVELLKLWFAHMQEVKPGIYVTYNGDFFDWPFLEKRAAHYGIKMSEEIGFQHDNIQGECRAKFSCHLDCFAWVKRDSYLPQGSQGLKAVTKAKLGYDPLEVNPEDMVRFARDKPQTMASYSVSDAVATYYLYMTYVHPFIFSLATIIPMPPDEVLRKGSGTLCEMLLMVQAYRANVICPNKHREDHEKFHNNRLLESETYIGGHVECLECGVFRADLPTKFQLDSASYEQLINNLDRDLQYAIRVEGKVDVDSIANYDDVKNAILDKLMLLRDHPMREECPLIYHLDVAAMYPNIILTNRLQPPSIVSDVVCTACDFNRPGKNCLRKLEWVWRGETYMAKKSDYYHMKKQIESELVESNESHTPRPFIELPKAEQQLKLKERLKKYCQKAYKRVLDKPVMEVREASICMRENPFYVNTVRSFRDRRYEYKGLNKVWKGKLADAKASRNSMKIQEAQDMVILYDSLQLAHKCILNSFYGYVMRKGARWYSMEMAGVVTYTGAKIIQNARLLVEKIGRPLELDTDGIWCALPGSFPENFTFKIIDANRKFTISYPCVMLNVDVARNNTNDQYQTLMDPITKTYATHSECSIEFEVDGPYKAMIIPASKEEGILIKKRYAVFNHDGSLAELKGFEIKRRGELKLIKVFQAEVFDKFLQGLTLEECYAAVAAVANRWLDLLDNQGIDIADGELLDYISESSTMSKSLVDYGEQKSCAVTTARRLADFLGDTMVKDKGLHCQYIVACEPQGTPVSERAIPVAIFGAEAEIERFYLRKWCKVSSGVGIRYIVDWSYYKQRLSSAIQKIITIPAAMQKVSNPVPRVLHPEWLHKKVREKEDRFRQRKLVDIFSTRRKNSNDASVRDLEDIVNSGNSLISGPQVVVLDTKVNKESHLVKQSFQANGLNMSQEPLIELNHKDASGESIDRNVDYQGWLAIKKRKWKTTLEKRKKRRLVGMNESHQSAAATKLPVSSVSYKHTREKNGLNSFFRKNELALLKSHWQVIQFVSSTKPGFFLAWIVVDGVMLKINLDVPRIFYLNSKAPVTEEFPGRRVNKILPHSRPTFNLIEVVIDEEQFRAESKKLASHLADPEVEGIYETKVPLEFNAVLQIGCVCQVDKVAKARNAQDSWNLTELHMKTTTECSYLEQIISFFYLYHSLSEGRAIYVLYFQVSGTISVVIVNPFQNKELSSSLLEKQFREACQAMSLESHVQASHASAKVEYVRTFEAGEKLVQRVLVEYRHRHHGPTVAVIECPKVHAIKSGVRVLDDFPCISVPCNTQDSNYQALGWQVTAGKIAMQRCAASSRWFAERIRLSRYAHVPIGNFELDWLLFTADIFFSRALRDQQQLLWVSDDGIPDLGGIYEGDTCFADEVNQPALTYPGAYRRVAVELKVHHLAVNALLKSSLVDEMEGGSLFGYEYDINYGSDANEVSDEASSCAPAFRVLKQLIQRCISDAVASGNEYADAILQHLYRWLCSPMSKLHDPALHRVLHKIMKKVFALLLAEFQKLGATIIFADFSKIIIDTGKLDMLAASAYCDCLIKTLQTRDLFEWIELEPLHFWHSLLFMDQHNFGGIQAKSSTDSVAENVDCDSQVDIVSSWSIADYLPKVTQDHFVLIVSEFLYLPWKHLKAQIANFNIRRDATTSTQSITVSTAETLESSVNEYLKDQISCYFSDKLLKIVCDTLQHFKGKNNVDVDNTETHVFKHFDSSHSNKGNAALEFIKHVCAVLALDQNVQNDILRLRKNLLKLVRVREFAPEAQFCDPCLSFTLPNVICSYCNDCRDLDLCRDPTLLDQEWRCAVPHCGLPYDLEQMENALLQIVRQRERLYHLQDLVCLKCRQVKAVHLAEQCGCGGQFRCVEDSSQFLSKMKVIMSIACRHKLQLLKDCTSWILEVKQ
ncbi:DNA polymerase epsilon catalytic subunit A isoform X1 [Dendrobium catenatum]|uniref:DNA polymerase epsilon catalytic subunit A isoform X1 n=1 Tax=Dendrobium catenatum TaxID=906689 RepID=UPI0010A05E96|nr:DNA polymerase epsilon catalytic subunit A isoform X1 [Dendrobium catenatum]XP_020701922.2 DNA polymerase epsilon catalytic subunit A isoform X1 [Dendrobium catenatum]